jgi:hypothetical protein
MEALVFGRQDYALTSSLLQALRHAMGISFLKSLFSADCLGSWGLIHQIEALESLPRWCVPVMIASEVTAFAVHRVPSGTVYRRLLDSGAALSTSFGLTLAGKSLYSRRSSLIFGSEVLKKASAHGQANVAGAWHQGLRA